MADAETAPRMVGRYELHRAIASGGMATVHLGQLRGQAGFTRIVAIKRLHPSFAEKPMLVSTLLDEARLCSRIQHPNVVATLDMVAEDEELSLVLEYVHGETLARLLGSSEEPPEPAVVAAIMAGALHGLHAAHEATSASGEPLALVHRDISPQNIMVGVDGLARVLDFGVAKARGRLQTTREGQVKGKLAYMAPEQIRGHVDRRSDIFAAGVVMWEALTRKRLFAGENEGHVLTNVLEAPIDPPSTHVDVDAELDAIVLRALERDPDARFATAHAFALAIEDAVPIAAATTVGAWVKESAAATLKQRAAWVAALESGETAPASEVDRSEEPTLPDTSVKVDTQIETRTDMAFGGTEPPPRRRWLPLAFAATATIAIAAVVGLRDRATASPTQPLAPDRAAARAAAVTPDKSAEPAPQPSAATTASVSASPAPRPSAAPPRKAKPPAPKAEPPTPPPAKSSPFYRFE